MVAVFKEEEDKVKQHTECKEPGWLRLFDEVFEEPEGVDTSRGVSHKIELQEGARAYRKVPYRMAEEQQKQLTEELTEFLQKGWIKPSKSEWATVALVVPKKDGKARICINYRDFNAISVQDAYPLPKIDELLNKLARARWFTKMDLRSGFHQIPMEESSKHLTAFRISQPIQGCSLFEWEVMPMELATAPATFQRWMDVSMRGLEDKMLVYLDDVLVFSESLDKHHRDVKEVLERFQEKGIKVKKEKCEFFKDRMPFLGHIVQGGTIRVDESKLTRLDEWLPPLKNVKQVRQLIGFLSYYRAFIPGFATMTAPITNLLRAGKGWQWTEEASEALEQAKKAMWDACERYAWDPVTCTNMCACS